jgi:Ca2+-binding EF-hand superfamily protein
MKAGQLFGMLDDNIDGKLQLSELKSPMAAPLRVAFAQIDTNKDGAIDAAEMKVAEAFMASGQGRRADAGGPAKN